MTQPIDRETIRQFAEESGIRCFDEQIVAKLQNVAKLAVAHSRKDAEPVAWQFRMKPEWHDAWVKWQPCEKTNFDDYVKAPVVNGWQFDARALFTHPPEADKLLQQALEALETRIFVGPAIAAIRTYLEIKNA